MFSLRYTLSSIKTTIINTSLYFKERGPILNFLRNSKYSNIRPFNLHKWHDDLYLFTAIDEQGDNVFIKLTKLRRLLENENVAYKKLSNNNFFKNHLIEYKEYLTSPPYKALVLNHAKGEVLSEDWMLNNIKEAGVLIKIVDELQPLSLVHRDIKLDNFIFEEGNIKIFDFSFMIDKSKKIKLRELDLSNSKNITKLLFLGRYYKPEPLKWDDYYSLYMIFERFYKRNERQLSEDNKTLVIDYINQCKSKIDSNSYSILK